MPERAVKGHVVNREHRRGSSQRRLAAFLDFEKRGNEAGLPIVGMNDFGPEVQRHGRHEHGPAEEHEALAVVDVVPALPAVQSLAVEILGTIDEQHPHFGIREAAFPEPAGHYIGSNRHIDRGPRLINRFSQSALLGHLPGIVGQDQRHLVPGFFQGFGERRRHVCKSPRLGIRNRFRTCKQNSHSDPLSLENIVHRAGFWTRLRSVFITPSRGSAQATQSFSRKAGDRGRIGSQVLSTEARRIDNLKSPGHTFRNHHPRVRLEVCAPCKRCVIGITPVPFGRMTGGADGRNPA